MSNRTLRRRDSPLFGIATEPWKADGVVPDRTLRWACQMCCKAFPTKAAMSVHLFKVHSRVAEYRYYATGTWCSACNTEYWSNGRLNAHLRASSRCTASLQRQGVRKDAVLPGFGSRQRRKADSEQFTLAPPKKGPQPSDPEQLDPVWSQVQRTFYRELCDILQEIGPEMTVDHIQQNIATVLSRHPVYPDETLQVFDYVMDEIRLLHAADPNDPWTPTQFSLLCTALERSGQEQWTTHKPSNAESRTAMSLVQFRRSMLKYEWASGLQELRAQNGTPATFHIS